MKLVFLERHCLYQLETCTSLISKPLLEASEPKRHPVQNATLFKKTFKAFTEIKSVWIKYKLETKSLLPVTKEL